MKLSEIDDLLAEFPSITKERVSKGGHYKVFLSTPSGRKMLVVSKTCSDHRAVLNNRAILRRWARGEA